jgi:antitoxin component of MazEF toxin-antitoxin module
MINIEGKIITKPWRGNSTGSLVVSLPKRIVKNCNLTTQSYITIDDQNGLITIKKLDLDNSK